MAIEIDEILARDFHNEEDRAAVAEKIKEEMTKERNPHDAYFIRSLLMLAGGSKEKFMSFFPVWDPRDWLMDSKRMPKAVRQRYDV